MNTNEAKLALQQLLEQLEGDLGAIAVYNSTTDEWDASFIDDASEESDDSLEADQNEAAEERIATLALLETRYRNVRRALEKIEAGTYGICEISGEPIEPARLSANPAARTCQKHLEDETFLPL